jgi:hypothetical protein
VVTGRGGLEWGLKGGLKWGEDERGVWRAWRAAALGGRHHGWSERLEARDCFEVGERAACNGE